MVEQFRVPSEKLVELPAGLDLDDASLVEPASVAWHGVRVGGTSDQTTVAGSGRAVPRCRRGSRSDRPGEFGERCRDALVVVGIKPEFVVAATQVLQQRVTAHDHLRGVVAFEAPHRSKPSFEPAMVGRGPCADTAGPHLRTAG